MKKIYFLFILSLSAVYFAEAQKPVANFSASKDSVCPGDTISFYDLSSNSPTRWSWYFQGALDSVSTDKNPQNIFYFSPGKYNVKLVVSNSSGSDSLTLANLVTVNPTPVTPTITQSNDTLCCSQDSSYAFYQWYNGGTPIPGGTNPCIRMQAPCDYNVAVKNKYGCGIAVALDIFCGPPRAVFSADKDTICQGDCASFTDLGICCIDNWHWTFQGADSASSNLENPANICYSSAGSFTVTLLVTSSAGRDSVTKSIVVVQPVSPQINFLNGADTALFFSSDPSYVSYQWYLGGNLIPGATDTILHPILDCHTHVYSVEITTKYGCTIGTNLICEGVKQFLNDEHIFLSPNPATNELTIHTSSSDNEAVTVSIMNVLGETMQSFSLSFGEGRGEADVSKLASGIYFLQLKGESGSVVKKFVKE